MGGRTFGWILSLMVLSGLGVIGSVGASEKNPVSGQESEWRAQAGQSDQPWAIADPAPLQVEVLEPLHRRLPRFFLSSSLGFSPGPVLQDSNGGGSCCGARLDELAGAQLNFDFRFWYLFVGSHLSIYGNVRGVPQEELREYALRAGFLIPIGERFSFVGTGWLGAASLYDVDLHWNDEGPVHEYSSTLTGNKHGLLAGASIGVRVMIATWFGVTADTSLSTVIFSPGLDEYRLNRFQVNSGVVFAW